MTTSPNWAGGAIPSLRIKSSGTQSAGHLAQFHNSDVKESERTHHVYSALHWVFAQVEELLALFPGWESPPADSIAGGSSTEPSENRYGQSGNESVAGVQGSLVTTTLGRGFSDLHSYVTLFLMGTLSSSMS